MMTRKKKSTRSLQ